MLVGEQGNLLDTMKFNIGDTIWIATAGNHNQVWVTCPDCLGQKFLTVITGDGTQHTIDCECCRAGCDCRGQIMEYKFVASVREAVVENIEVRDGQTRYNHQDEADVFSAEGEARARAESFRAQHEADELRRMTHCKEHPRKSWAWNVTYHRRELKRALHNVEYHTSKLNVAKTNAKEPESQIAA